MPRTYNDMMNIIADLWTSIIWIYLINDEFPPRDSRKFVFPSFLVQYKEISDARSSNCNWYLTR